MTAGEGFERALAALAHAFSELPAGSAALVGGVAVIARGVARLTADIDGLAAVDAVSVDTLVEILGRHEIGFRIEDGAAFARRHHVLLLEHRPSSTAIDLALAFLPFEAEALAAATFVDFGGAKVPVLRAEDLVIQKCVAWRPVDRQDVERLLLIGGDKMDLDRVRKWVGQFADLLETPERRDELERLIRQAQEG